MGTRTSLRAIYILSVSVLFSGCNTQDLLNQIKSLIQPSEQVENVKEDSDSDGISSAAAKRAKANAELMRELWFVVLQREPKDKIQFADWVDTINQGGSIEGIYNGLTHSAMYRRLESGKKGASAGALKIFTIELARLRAELKDPTEFDQTSALPLQQILPPGMGSESEEDTGMVSYDKQPKAGEEPPKKPPYNVEKKAQEYGTLFLGASVFTLKRVIGDEALKVMEEKLEYREKFALWYSKWAVRMARDYPLDYGLDLRRSTDEEFHYRWALKADRSRLAWEILNRLHRLINHANDS